MNLISKAINNTKVKQIPPKVVEIPQPAILKVECSQETITAYLSDSRVISIPTGWYKVLREANLEQLKNVRILPAKKGIHWPDLEEF